MEDQPRRLSTQEVREHIAAVLEEVVTHQLSVDGIDGWRPTEELVYKREAWLKKANKDFDAARRNNRVPIGASIVYTEMAKPAEQYAAQAAMFLFLEKVGLLDAYFEHIEQNFFQPFSATVGNTLVRVVEGPISWKNGKSQNKTGITRRLYINRTEAKPAAKKRSRKSRNKSS
jgi:hypothetical protein